MITFIKNKRTTLGYRILSAFIAFTFIFGMVIPPQVTYAQLISATVLNLPAPGTLLPISSGYTPALITGLTIYPENPLEFDFMIDIGDSGLAGDRLEDESQKLIKYFLASLTVPEDELWVNLSPYEEDRIIPKVFGETEMGRDLLAQDYLLKQLTASLMYPEDELGKKFWDRVYKKAYDLYGTTEIPMNTFNKVWIVPEKAVVFESGNGAFVLESHLKVMLEEDYAALKSNLKNAKFSMDQVLEEDAEVISGVTSEVVREILIPEIEREVNEGETFANLRQIYNSMILAAWYKQNLKETLLGQVYVDQNKIKGVDVDDKQVKQKIYARYLDAFKKGVYNYIREDYDPVSQEIVPRKYFSGGYYGTQITTALSAFDINDISALRGEREQFISFLAYVKEMDQNDFKDVVLPELREFSLNDQEYILSRVSIQSDIDTQLVNVILVENADKGSKTSGAIKVEESRPSSPISITPQTRPIVGDLRLDPDAVKSVFNDIKSTMERQDKDTTFDEYIIDMGGEMTSLIMSVAQVDFPDMLLNTNVKKWYVFEGSREPFKQWVSQQLALLNEKKDIMLLDSASLDLSEAKSVLSDIEKTMQRQDKDKTFDEYIIDMGGNMTALIMAVAQVKFSSDIQFDTIAEDWHVFEGSREPFKRWVGRQLEIVNNETASSPINIAPETQMFLGGMNLNLDEVRYELEGIKNIMQWLEDKPHDGYIIAMGGSVKLLIMSAAQIKFPGMWLDTRTGDWHVLAEDHPLLKQWVDDRLSEIEANKNVALLEGEGAILDLDKVKSDLEDIQKTMEEQRGDQLFEHYDISMGGDTKLLIMSAAQVQFPYDIQFNAFTENWYVAWKDPRQFEQWVGRQLDIVNALSASSPINQYDIDIGNAYWNGDLITTPITRPFRASLKEDVKDMTTLTEQEAVLSERFALESLLRGEGYIGILLAGASGRMNVDKAPKDARNMVGGRKIKSKAAVPVGKVDGRVITYLDAFGISVARLLMEIESAAQKEGQESKVMQNDIGFLSNDRYRSEHDEILLKNNFYGLSPELFRFYHQPVGAKFVGTPEEVEKLNAQGKFNTEEDYLEALEYSKTIAERRKTDPSVVVLKGEADPLGHGEFFHQMILSGELLHMHDTGKKWVFIRNIDNYAAKFDKKWLQILGAFLAEQLDFQGEVSPRSPGLKGGNLIVMTDTGSHQIAETPNIDETNKIRKKKGETPIKDSYWFNNAVGLMTIRYIISLYKKEGQADKGFIQELRYASESQLTEIANRGREKFPKILDPKPAKNMGAAAVKAETNLWQSTGVVDDDIMKVRGIGVRGGRNFPINDYLDGTISPKQKQEELANLRFLATKQWVVTSKRKEDLRGSINRAMVENGIDRMITDEELALTFESYEGNKLLVNDILRYILETESVTDGILNNNALRRLVSESNVFNEKEEAAENASSPITLETIEARLTDATVATDQFEESLDEFVGGLAKNEMMPALDALKRMATTVGESTPKGGVLTAYSKVLIGDISREIKKDVPRGDSTVSSPIVPTKTIKTERDAIKAMRVYLKNPEVKRINRKGSGPKDVSSHYILQLYWYTHLYNRVDESEEQFLIELGEFLAKELNAEGLNMEFIHGVDWINSRVGGLDSVYDLIGDKVVRMGLRHTGAGSTIKNLPFNLKKLAPKVIALVEKRKGELLEEESGLSKDKPADGTVTSSPIMEQLGAIAEPSSVVLTDVNITVKRLINEDLTFEEIVQLTLGNAIDREDRKAAEGVINSFRENPPQVVGQLEGQSDLVNRIAKISLLERTADFLSFRWSPSGENYRNLDGITDRTMGAISILLEQLENTEAFQNLTPVNPKNEEVKKGKFFVIQEGKKLRLFNGFLPQWVKEKEHQPKIIVTQGSTKSSSPVGGIDLNPELLDLQIRRDGNGIPLPIGQQPIYNMNIEGFFPVIINITPIVNTMPLLLGLVDEETGSDDLSFVPTLDPMRKIDRFTLKDPVETGILG